MSQADFKRKLEEIKKNQINNKRKTQLPQRKFWRRFVDQEVSHFYRKAAIQSD